GEEYHRPDAECGRWLGDALVDCSANQGRGPVVSHADRSCFEPYGEHPSAGEPGMKRTALLTVVLALFAVPAAAADPLASWSDGPARRAILEFVAEVTREG